MKCLTDRLLYKGNDIGRQNMLWNIAGSFCYALASMVLSMVVMRMAGEDEGGIFSFGFSTLGQQMFIIAYFGIRPFQITDGKGEYSFGDYLSHRRLTCLLALAAGGLYLGFKVCQGAYTPYKAWILLLLVFYKVADGYGDVYESEFQRQGSLYLTGKANFFRTILSVAVFLITLAASKSLLTACMAAALAQILGLRLFDTAVLPALPGTDWKKRPGMKGRIFKSTSFLFASAFLDFYVFSSAKYAIDGRLDDAASGYFNLIFMPTSVIYMVANFIIRPFLTRLTELWDGRDFKTFKKELGRLGGIILGLTVLAVGATALLGKWVLTVLELLLGGAYAGALSVYSGAFTVIVLGGGLYALANLMYYALVIMRRQKAIFTVYLLAAAAAAAGSGWMVSGYGIMGAAVCYLLLMTGLALGFGLCTLGAFRREQKENARNGGR